MGPGRGLASTSFRSRNPRAACGLKVVNEPDMLEALYDVGHSFGYRLRPLSMTAGAPVLGLFPCCALQATASIYRGIDGFELAYYQAECSHECSHSVLLDSSRYAVILLQTKWHATPHLR